MSVATNKQLEARVSKGIKWLDKQMPRKKWLKKINLRNFNIESKSTCVLGSVFDDFDNIVNEFGRTEKRKSSQWAASHGFYSYSRDAHVEQRTYDKLQVIWSKRFKKMKAIK